MKRKRRLDSNVYLNTNEVINLFNTIVALENSKLSELKVEMQEISTAANELVEKIEYLFSNLENASDNQLESIKQISKTMDMLYLKVLFEEYKRS